jgi:hypothetical protein
VQEARGRYGREPASVTVVDGAGGTTTLTLRRYGTLGTADDVEAIRHTTRMGRPIPRGSFIDSYCGFVDRKGRAHVILPGAWWDDDELRRFAFAVGLGWLVDLRAYADDNRPVARGGEPMWHLPVGHPPRADGCIILHP